MFELHQVQYQSEDESMNEYNFSQEDDAVDDEGRSLRFNHSRKVFTKEINNLGLKKKQKERLSIYFTESIPFYNRCC